MNVFYCVILFLIQSVTPAFSWDVGVTLGDQINFLSQDGELQGIAAEKFTKMSAMTYDPLHRHIYFSDFSNSNFSIFRLKLDNSTQSKVIQPLLIRQSVDTEIQGLAFDAMTLTLFWTTGKGNSLNRLKLNSLFTAQPQKGEVFLNLGDEVPIGIVVDSCRRKLYYTNCNGKLATIESLHTDGSNKVTLVNTNLFQPHGITIDQPSQKLYWSDEEVGYGYRIERSNLDGTNRETLVKGSHHQPIAIAVDNSYVYWSDWVQSNVWKINRSLTNIDGTKPVLFYHYNNKLPVGLITQTDLSYITENSCSILLELKRKVLLPVEEQAILNDVQNSSLSDRLLNYCLNNGIFHSNGTCVCSKGYSGKRCEVSLCHNFCIMGQCSLDSEGFPSCSCPMNRTGLRCQVDLCFSLCLNGGSCLVVDTNKTECQCPSGFFGKRCESRSAQQNELCKAYCSYYIAGSNYQHMVRNPKEDGVLPNPPPLCSCDDMRNSEHYEPLENNTGPSAEGLNQYSMQDFNVYLSSSLGLLCAMLLIIIIMLALKVSTLSKRPRVKKRFVVNKAVTPLTSRPSAQQPSESCEITIENCCNMNICETPCFEPDFRNAKSSVIHRKSKEEKANLLSDMEVESQDESLY